MAIAASPRVRERVLEREHREVAGDRQPEALARALVVDRDEHGVVVRAPEQLHVDAVVDAVGELPGGGLVLDLRGGGPAEQSHGITTSPTLVAVARSAT